jgi:hypothetical protein
MYGTPLGGVKPLKLLKRLVFIQREGPGAFQKNSLKWDFKLLKPKDVYRCWNTPWETCGIGPVPQLPVGIVSPTPSGSVFKERTGMPSS